MSKRSNCMWDDLVRLWRLTAEGRMWSSSFPISALLVQPGQYGTGPQSSHAGNIQLFTLPEVSSNTQAGLTWAWHPIPLLPPSDTSLLTVLDVLWQSSAPLWPKFSSKRASISCYYQQLPKLYLSSLRAFIQLTPHKSQPLVLTLLAHVQLFRFLPVSCAEVPACLTPGLFWLISHVLHVRPQASQWHNEGA